LSPGFKQTILLQTNNLLGFFVLFCLVGWFGLFFARSIKTRSGVSWQPT
jgi:hypothetical protein